MPENAALAHRLVAEQFPQWSGAAVTPLSSGGTDNALYRLGPDLVVRLPLNRRAAAEAAIQAAWLPRLRPYHPFAGPAPLARGEPARGQPWPWFVRSRLEGTEAAHPDHADSRHVAQGLAGFLTALHHADAANAPPPRDGVRLEERDRETRAAVDALRGEIDAAAALAVWERARATLWTGRPVWVHGAIRPEHVLVRRDDYPIGVLGWGAAGAGDPALDTVAGWTWLTPYARSVFRDHLDADDAAWQRGRGWALSGALRRRATPEIARLLT